MTRERNDRGHRHVWRWVALVVAVFVLLGAGAFVVAWRASGARQVSLDEARKRFGSSSTTIVAAPANVLRPPAGVYEYGGSGHESLDKPPKSQNQGPLIPATVSPKGANCWTFRADYSTGHWQSWDYCSTNGDLVERGGQTYEKWDFVMFQVTSTSTFTCPSSVTIKPGMKPGDTWTQTCTGTTSAVKGQVTTSGPYTYVGPVTLTIGGTPVAAYRFHRERTLSGAQTGTERDEVWFAQSNAMPLRNDRVNVVHSDSPIGTVTYTESGSFTLQSLTPR